MRVPSNETFASAEAANAGKSWRWLLLSRVQRFAPRGKRSPPRSQASELKTLAAVKTMGTVCEEDARNDVVETNNAIRRESSCSRSRTNVPLPLRPAQTVLRDNWLADRYRAEDPASWIRT